MSSTVPPASNHGSTCAAPGQEVVEGGRPRRGLQSLELVVRYTLEISDVPDEALAGLLASELGAEAGETVMTTAEQLLEQGIEQGFDKGRRDVLLRQIHLRFGGLAEEYVVRIESADSERLDALTERVLTANSVGELFR